MSKVTPLLFLTLAAAGACSNDDPFSPEAARSEPAFAAGSAAGEAQIRDLAAALEAAWVAKNAAAYAAPYHENVVFIQPTGAVINGRAAVQGMHAGLFAGPGAQSSIAITIQRVEFLTGTLAVVDLTLDFTGFAGLAPGIRPTSPGLLRSTVRWIVQHRAGEWLIVAAQMTPVPPAP